MPEGDSVYLVAAKLRPQVVGRTVADGELRSGEAAGMRLRDVRIVEMDTHGKHLLTRFDDGSTLHTHLLMQGSWTITGPGKVLPRTLLDTVRVRMRLDDDRTLWGVDMPIVQLLPTAREHDAIGHLGPDPLRADWDAGEAQRRLAARPDREFVAALLDQRNLAGLGNLWVNELAFLRGTHPFAPIGSVQLEPLIALAARALRVSATMPGMYQVTTGRRAKGEQHWVSGRAGRPCLRCGTTVQVRAQVDGDPERRRTWWCPRCQPQPA